MFRQECETAKNSPLDSHGNPSHILLSYAFATSLGNGLNQEQGLIWK